MLDISAIAVGNFAVAVTICAVAVAASVAAVRRIGRMHNLSDACMSELANLQKELQEDTGKRGVFGLGVGCVWVRVPFR